MDYVKFVEMIPEDKLGPISDQLIGFILTSKNEDRMPPKLANCMLSTMQQGLMKTKTGVSVILEAAVLLDPEKTVGAFSEMQMLNVAEQITKELLARSK